MSCPSGVAYEPAANPYASVTVTAQNWRQLGEMTPTNVIRIFAGTLRYTARASRHGRFDKPVVGGAPAYRHPGLVPAFVDEAAMRELKWRIRGSAQLADNPPRCARGLSAVRLREVGQIGHGLGRAVRSLQARDADRVPRPARDALNLEIDRPCASHQPVRSDLASEWSSDLTLSRGHRGWKPDERGFT